MLNLVFRFYLLSKVELSTPIELKIMIKQWNTPSYPPEPILPGLRNFKINKKASKKSTKLLKVKSNCGTLKYVTPWFPKG
jgi:hypothetical protein